MQPLMVTNLRPMPGFAAYRPALRPMPYAPAPYRRPATLGQPSNGRRRHLGAFSVEEVPSSIVIAGVGAGAFYISGVLPTPWDLVTKGVSAMAIGYALYRVFSAPPPEAPATPTGAQVGPATPIARQEDFALITASFTTPKNYSTASYSFFTGKYPVELLVSYGLADSEIARAQQQPVTVIIQLEAVEKPYYYGSSGDQASGIVGSQQIVLNPGDQRPITFSPATISSTNYFAAATLSVTLNAYKVRAGGVGRELMTSVTFFLK